MNFSLKFYLLGRYHCPELNWINVKLNKSDKKPVGDRVTKVSRISLTKQLISLKDDACSDSTQKIIKLQKMIFDYRKKKIWVFFDWNLRQGALEPTLFKYYDCWSVTVRSGQFFILKLNFDFTRTAENDFWCKSGIAHFVDIFQGCSWTQ